jgi:hypothetical protein
VTFAGFMGSCSGLNGQILYVNHASLTSSSFIAYVATSTAVTDSADTSAGTITSVSDAAPFVLFNPSPKGGLGDYMSGTVVLQGSDAWTKAFDATNDTGAQIAMSIASNLATGTNYQVPIPPLYSYGKGVTGTSSTPGLGSFLLADCPAGGATNCFGVIGGGQGGPNSTSNGGIYLGVDGTHLTGGNRAGRIQVGQNRDLILGAGSISFANPAADGGIIDQSNWFGWGSGCSFIYTGTNANTAATCPWALDTHGIVHQLGNGNTPTASAGSIASGTNADGTIGGLLAVTSFTMTFANGGWSTWVSCTANSSEAGNQPAVTSTLTTVTFTFASEFTGTVSYHCGGK